jgi:hypothetical protein
MLPAMAKSGHQPLRKVGNNFIYKQIWRGVNVERWAVAAEEVRHDKPGQSKEKYFAWMCVNEQRLSS